MAEKKRISVIIYVLSFCIPALILAFSYYQQGIYPGGPNTVLIYDMRGEMLPLYGYLSDLGPGYDNLFHWMSGGLGGGFIGSAAMYLSLFDVCFSFVPTSFIPTAIYLLLLLKVALCGLFFSVYVTHTAEKKIKPAFIVTLASCYALMSYSVAYSMLLVWLDGVMLLPLLALFLEKIISEKKSLPFVILMSICIIDDYYIAYMIAGCLAIYMIFRLIEISSDKASFIRRFILFVFHGLLSAGISCFVLIPVGFDLSKGKLSQYAGLSDGLIVKNNLISVLKMLLPSNYSNLGSNQPPYIYCGSIVLVLVIFWMISGKKNLKTKIAAFLIVGFYFCSFMIGPLDRIWHGFRDPIGFSCRYSFTFVFLLSCFAIRGLDCLSMVNLKISDSLRKLISVVVIIYTFMELSMNSSYLISKLMEEYNYANREEYERICDVMNYTLANIDLRNPDSYGRLVKNFNYSCSDGALFGYDGLEMFTSSYNSSLIDFLRAMGLNSSENFIKEPGMTPALANLLNVRYYMSYWYDMSDYYDPIIYYRSHGLYRNDNALPFAFRIETTPTDSLRDLNDNPFGNINTVYSDVFGRDVDCSVFDLCEYDLVDNEDSVTVLKFIPEQSGHYWIYPQKNIYSSNNGKDYIPSELAYLTYCVDGVAIGECGFYNFRHCGDLGYLESGREYTISFEYPVSVVGDIQLAYFDKELCNDLTENVSGLNISEIGRDGIVLNGYLDEPCEMLLTIPYDSIIIFSNELIKSDSGTLATISPFLNI